MSNEEPPIPTSDPIRGGSKDKRLQQILMRLRATDFPSIRMDAFERFANPQFIAKRFPLPDRGTQWASAFLLPFVIIGSFAILVAWHELLASILAGGEWGSQSAIMAFLVTALDLFAFCFTAYLWFQFVRTGGFGILGQN